MSKEKNKFYEHENIYFNFVIMDIQTRKIQFVQTFLKLQSEKVISRLEQILEKETQNEFKPFTIKELNKRIDQSMEDSKNGRVTESSELKSKIAQWR